MPHKRKVRRDPPTKLIFEPENSFLYLRISDETADSYIVPLDTLLTIFILKYISDDQIQVYLVKERVDECTVEVNKSVVHFQVTKDIPVQVQRCRLPVWYLPGQQTCLAGLCSVVRYAVKLVAFSSDCPEVQKMKTLLGHQLNCLSAPAEVSTWTKYCELSLRQATSAWLSRDEMYYPEEVTQLETHIRQPVRIHNARKRMQDLGTIKTTQQGSFQRTKDAQGKDVDPILLYAQEQHLFAEGPDFLISDLLLYPCIYLIQSSLGIQFEKHYPLITRWMERVSEKGTESLLKSLLKPLPKDDQDWRGIAPTPVPDESLYKCDPKREACKTFTNQMDVEKNLDWWQESGLESLQKFKGREDWENLDWASLPKLVHPQAGQLPADRLERKCHQLQGLAIPLMELTRRDRPGGGRCVLVDFCSGGGHLGLLLAHLMPEVEVHLVENKEESLARGRERGTELNLDNVWYFQANLEYYQGKFDVCTSLHACGVATDLVIYKAVQQKADFVCTPCCYGGVQSLNNIQYPRSGKFREAGCTEKDYIIMGHTADQTKKGCAPGIEKGEQGTLFMDIVDTDRALYCIENNYTVSLDKILPLSCSPKHNIIIAEHHD